MAAPRPQGVEGGALSGMVSGRNRGVRVGVAV